MSELTRIEYAGEVGREVDKSMWKIDVNLAARTGDFDAGGNPEGDVVAGVSSERHWTSGSADDGRLSISSGTRSSDEVAVRTDRPQRGLLQPDNMQDPTATIARTYKTPLLDRLSKSV